MRQSLHLRGISGMVTIAREDSRLETPTSIQELHAPLPRAPQIHRRTTRQRSGQRTHLERQRPTRRSVAHPILVRFRDVRSGDECVEVRKRGGAKERGIRENAIVATEIGEAPDRG